MKKIKGLYNLKNKNIKSKKRNKRGKLLNTSLTMDLININHKRKLYDSITNNNKLIKLHKRYKLNNKLYTKHFNNKISQKIYRKNFFNKLKLNNEKTYKNFTISSINLRSLKRRKEELINYLTKNEIDLMALQETWINKNTFKIKVKNYKLINTAPNDTKGTGVAFIVKNDIKIKNIVIKNLNKGIEYISLVIIFKNFKNIKFISIYIHPYAKNEDIEDTLSKFNTKDTIIMGDVNAHSPIWSQGTPNKRGNIIEEYFIKNNMKLLDLKLQPTYCPINEKTKNSSPDLVAYKNNLKGYISRF